VAAAASLDPSQGELAANAYRPRYRYSSKFTRMNAPLAAATKAGTKSTLVPDAERQASSRLPWLLAGGAAAVAVGVAAWWTLGRAPVLSYVTAAVDRGVVARSVTASGTVNPVLTIIVGSYVSGVIENVSCDYNTRVRKGQVCAQIDPRPYQMTVAQEAAALATAKAQVVKDQANLDYAEVNLKRGEDLLKLDSIARDTVDVARNNRDQARAQLALDNAAVQQHQASLQASQINLGYTKITSPVDGTVVSRNVTQGQTVAASFQTPTLFLIATDLTKMQVDANVSESDIGGSGSAVKEGDAADFTVDAYPDTIFHGMVSQVRQAPQTVQNVVTYDVVIAIDNDALLLKPGMTATARIVTAEHKDVLRIPNAALRYHPGGSRNGGQSSSTSTGAGQGERAAAGGHSVYVLRDGKPAQVKVKTGLADDARTEIVSDALRQGDGVIVSEQAAAARRASPRPSLRL
jgi:HlyD family secretion protein